MEHYYAMIMAGGGGTRLWPLSRKNTPKQVLPLVEEHSLFRTSVLRLAPLFPPERIYVVTGSNIVESLRAETPEIPAENFIVEPYGRDSAPAAALGITVIHKRDPQAIVAILTADHHIAKKEDFRNVLKFSAEIAQKGHIVTLGISPTFPATGFGYIRQGEKLEQIGHYTAYQSLGFTEKPDVIRATRFLATGEYTWNSGMFIWTAEMAMSEFERQRPQMYQLMRALHPVIDTPAFFDKLHEVWEDMPKISIDFAIMEGARQMVVIPVDIGWSDVGSWASLFDVLEQDKFGNCSKGASADSRIALDTRDTLVYSHRLTVTIGVRDMIIVDTADALLICHRDRAQEVKDVVNYLRANKNDDYL